MVVSIKKQDGNILIKEGNITEKYIYDKESTLAVKNIIPVNKAWIIDKQIAKYKNDKLELPDSIILKIYNNYYKIDSIEGGIIVKKLYIQRE